MKITNLYTKVIIMLYIVLFMFYFSIFSYLFHDAESHQTSENRTAPTINLQPDFYTQVKELMIDDTEPEDYKNEPTPITETINTSTSLSYKDLMQVPFDIIKAVASEMNLQLTGNKSQFCSRLKNRVTQQDIEAQLQLA